MPHLTLFSLILILPLCSQQDISFPTSVQDDKTSDTELLQSPSLDQPLNMELEISVAAPQNMIEINVEGNLHQDLGHGGGDDVVNAVLDLSLQLEKRSGKKEGYWVYSPISIAASVYMLLLGSYGKTYSELASILRVKSDPSSLKPHQEFSSLLKYVQNTKGDSVVKIASSVFVQQGFNIRQDYRNIASTLYESHVESLDFLHQSTESRLRINSWTKRQTRDKIQEVLTTDPVPTTKMILVNTLYFKADWEKPFPSDLTKLHTFYPNGRFQPSALKVQMMANQGTYKYHQDKTLNLEIVGIPYKGGSLYMYLILPQDSNSEKVSYLLQTLTGNEINRLADNTVPLHNMIVAMPKINVTTEVKLGKSLRELGVQTIFNRNEADLSLLATGTVQGVPQVEDDRFIFTRSKKINVTESRKRRQAYLEDKRKIEVPLSNPGVYVDTVVHQVVLEVNERGTEAAAATTAMLSKTLTRTVKADAPYLLLVRHEPTRAPLLLAAVARPPHAG